MQYRPLGQTGIQVSVIGFGAWGIGGYQPGQTAAYGETDDQQSLAALAQAKEVGISFFDTADLYGNGHSETLLGKAFGHCRDQVVLATKAGYTAPTAQQAFEPQHLRRSLHQSLKRLRSDYVDLFQLHDPSPVLLQDNPAIWDTMQGLKKEGLVRAIGISLRSPTDGLILCSQYQPDCVQVNFNLIDQRLLDTGLLNQAVNQQIALVIRTPLCFGFLTGTYGTADFAEGDHRSRWSVEQRQRWHQAQQQFQACFAPDSQATPAQQALRFCLSYPVTTLIPGILTPAQAQENALAGALPPLAPAELQALRDVYHQHEFFLGPLATQTDKREG